MKITTAVQGKSGYIIITVYIYIYTSEDGIVENKATGHMHLSIYDDHHSRYMNIELRDKDWSPCTAWIFLKRRST